MRRLMPRKVAGKTLETISNAKAAAMMTSATHRVTHTHHMMPPPVPTTTE
jgi:hypothetical protein